MPKKRIMPAVLAALIAANLFVSAAAAQDLCLTPISSAHTCVQEVPTCFANKSWNHTYYAGGLALLCDQWADTEIKRIFLGEQVDFLNNQMTQLIQQLKDAGDDYASLERRFRRAKARSRRCR